MKTFAALSLTAALLGAAAVSLPVSSAQAAPIGAMASVLDAGKPVVEQVQYRRAAPARRGYVRRGGRGGDGAALAAGLIGAAIIGGAIIENQRRERYEERAYYYGNGGYYDDGYYAQPNYVAPRRRYVDPGYYGQPAYGYHPHRRHNVVRDPAGGGVMRVP